MIVLNGADEGVAQVARGDATGARLVVSDVNRGFAGASNLGRSAASTEAIVLLHDDVEVEPGWLGLLLAAAERHPSAAIVGPRVLGPDGRVQLAGAVMFRDGHPELVHNGAPSDHPDVLTGRSVDFVSSCCALVRATVWEAAGGIDEHFFPAGYGDADLAFAARRARWDVRVEPAAIVRHSGGGTLPAGFKGWLHGQNRSRFVERWATALEDHEPPGDRGPTAVQRALHRAATRARRLGTPRVEPGSTEGRTIDPTTLPAREVALMRAYVEDLDTDQEHLRMQIERLNQELDRVHNEHAKLNVEHERMASEVRRLADELRDTHERAALEIGARDLALADKDTYIASLLEHLEQSRGSAPPRAR